MLESKIESFGLRHLLDFRCVHQIIYAAANMHFFHFADLTIRSQPILLIATKKNRMRSQEREHNHPLGFPSKQKVCFEIVSAL